MTANQRTEEGLGRLARFMMDRRAEVHPDGAERILANPPTDEWFRAVALRLASSQEARAEHCSGVEQAMGWMSGSVERILAGGDPEDLR